ncbi:hypothetical protein BD560DRAFT_44472 [Blakeslea trispora]|nr:hypothetical protein BD560DRAFT_44472 [Blakeslea trispora]
METNNRLVTGSAHGQFKALFAKVKQIHEKYGPFQVHLCVGDFFGPDTSSIQELLDNQIEGISKRITF